MSERVQFHAGVPVQVTLAAPGELVSGTWKDVVIYQLQNGQTMYLDTEVAASVNLMEIQPGEKFRLQVLCGSRNETHSVERLACS